MLQTVNIGDLKFSILMFKKDSYYEDLKCAD